MAEAFKQFSFSLHRGCYKYKMKCACLAVAAPYPRHCTLFENSQSVYLLLLTALQQHHTSLSNTLQLHRPRLSVCVHFLIDQLFRSQFPGLFFTTRFTHSYSPYFFVYFYWYSSVRKVYRAFFPHYYCSVKELISQVYWNHLVVFSRLCDILYKGYLKIPVCA